MTKSKRYITRYFGRSIEMSKANSSILVYRFPYQNLKSKDESFAIDNQFVVYILLGKNDSGKDAIYVGKSKNGIKNRPVAHEDKYPGWDYCYILTQFKERTFFNDGSIQYIEDKLNNQVNKIDRFINKTISTTAGTANRTDEEVCDEFIDEALQMLDILGLDLITYNTAEKCVDEDNGFSGNIPDGIYYLSRKIKREHNEMFNAKMQVTGNKFIVLKGSRICPSETFGLMDSIINKRSSANIVNNVLNEDVILDSPSAAGAFVIGGVCNGWSSWKCNDKQIIDKFRR